jgi:hypothetical protein
MGSSSVWKKKSQPKLRMVSSCTGTPESRLYRLLEGARLRPSAPPIWCQSDRKFWLVVTQSVERLLKPCHQIITIRFFRQFAILESQIYYVYYIIHLLVVCCEIRGRAFYAKPGIKIDDFERNPPTQSAIPLKGFAYFHFIVTFLERIDRSMAVGCHDGARHPFVLISCKVQLCASVVSGSRALSIWSVGRKRSKVEGGLFQTVGIARLVSRLTIKRKG